MIGNLPLDFIQTAAGKTKIAPERFKNADEIVDVCRSMVHVDSQRSNWRASIDGLVNGNPVYSRAQLKAKGQGWRARVNYREAEGLLCSRQTAFFDLVSEVDPCIQVCLDYGKGVESADWALAMARNFHWMLMKAWRDGFNYHIPLHQMEMLKHGIGYHIWTGDQRNWIPDTPLTGEILFPDDAKLNIREGLDYFMMRDFLPGFALYRPIANEKAATTMGWNVDAVWSALAQSSKNKQTRSGTTGFTTEKFMREMKAGDLGTTQSRQAGLWVNHLFVREIDTDEISQYIVCENVTPKVNNPRDPWGKVLFRKRNRFSDWPLVMLPFDMGTGGLIHTVRGLGARTKDFFELNNRVLNSMVDQVLTGATITVKQTGQVDADQLRLMRFGMLSLLPKGVEAAQGVQFQQLAQGPIALLGELKGRMNQNNENYVQTSPEPMDRETAKSFEMRAQNAGQLSKGTHSQYSSNYCKLLTRMFLTACRKDAIIGNSWNARLARAFQSRNKRAGVPDEAYDHIDDVDEVLSTGAGSAAARIDAMLGILKYIYPTTTEERKINIERDYVAAITSGKKVDRYARSHDDGDLPNSDASLAVQENNGMMDGGDALATTNQDHVMHLQQHLPKANEVAQGVMQGQMDPAQGLKVLQKFGEHTGQHLKFLQSNPMRKAQFDAFYKEWIALSQIADKLSSQVQQAQQAQGQPSPEEKVDSQREIGLAKVASGEKVGMAKIASQARVDLSKIALQSRIKGAELKLKAQQQSSNGATARK